MTPLLVADGRPTELVAAATNELFDPDRWFPTGTIVADAAAPLPPATIVTSDAGDLTRLAGHLSAMVAVAVI